MIRSLINKPFSGLSFFILLLSGCYKSDIQHNSQSPITQVHQYL